MDIYVVKYQVGWEDQPLLTFGAIDGVRDFLSEHTGAHFNADITLPDIISPAASRWRDFEAGLIHETAFGNRDMVKLRRLTVDVTHD